MELVLLRPPKWQERDTRQWLSSVPVHAHVCVCVCEQVVLLRPPKWQERDTRQWLSSLSLDLLPEEEAAPMLENPLRCVRGRMIACAWACVCAHMCAQFCMHSCVPACICLGW